MAKVKSRYGPATEDATLGDAADRYRSEQQKQAAVDAAPGLAPGDAAAPDWLKIAKASYEASTSFLETSIRKQWERNERAFQSRHAFGSKYLSEGYKRRSRLYRPKTRSMMRQGEAQLAAAYFSQDDVISTKAMDPGDALSVVAADIMKELVQYRLMTPNKKWAVSWFLTCGGAYQDAQKYGVVQSKQWWEFEERKFMALEPMISSVTGFPVLDDGGQPLMAEKEKTEVLIDRPRIDLIPPENLRIDRSAHWMDPINTSPVVVVVTPMYVSDVEKRMTEADSRTGQPPWHFLDRTQLKAASSRHNWDTTRQQREEGREPDPEEKEIDEFSIMWVHENFVKWGKRDYVYYTAGVHHMLSDPTPIEEIYRHCSFGERPIVMGYGVIETHKTYPSGKPELIEGLQMEANELVNSRLDNIKLAMNKRFLVRRGRQVDIQSLMRASSASVTFVSDTQTDVKEMDIKDVTATAYAEQERINADMDELSGTFSIGTIQTSRKLNETVGGMRLLSGAQNSLGELDLRVFTATWAEPVLRQVVEMERHYESDVTVIGIAASRAKVFEKYGISEITDELIDRDLLVTINVGIGATDPQQKISRFLMGAKAIGEIVGEDIKPFLNIKEITKEVMGILGYRDGARFFSFETEAPTIEALLKKIEGLQQQLEGKQLDNQAKVEVARLGAMSRIAQQQIENEGRMDVEKVRATVGVTTAAGDRETEKRIAREKNVVEFAKEVMRGHFAMRKQDAAKTAAGV